MTTPLLKVENLRIALAGDGVTYDAVENVSFEIGRGEAFGLVGESGCGKSITALSVMGLLRRPLSLAGGRIILDGKEIQNVSAAEMRRLRGKRIAMIFQEPMTALNPLSPVGRQIAEMFVLHEGANWNEAMDRAEDALRQVRVPSPERRIKDYPHQLSGGMRQRVMIAIALACGPDLLVADEPTTALDVTVQAEIIDLMAELCAAKGTAVLMISHDLGLVANMCQRVAVMYAGRIVESQVADAIFATPTHPYTQGLIDSLPRLGERARRGRQKLSEISGVVPSIANYPAGCRFNPRCPAVTDVCRTIVPEATPLPADGVVRCHHHG
ncbi:MAG: peptide ABC transporter ATP-binding protein [Rhodospirillales bacterium 24-66-33]|jgi:peptide/nickel transport system ATP-binding protein|uniref:ABC transporter ATP-binding protein n=3 Tax=Reyranella sp. TaxID=1929291 RepID=UPI000BC577EF|nr:ABC transporter ATP-binding protein [Reyranella sp.]OYY38750.1 MAG: peptide ABC transporter ATP-binding protein [Rhodospirillales bacterium 35-66-84]OYZ92221.1 MAG: peptide ABC transporter ATP-binding protein [Rhodospirillales bacterium 24-66-33]OZB23625.1 MAG: peptide ABC transporter ATP-binding protein [Rhodospirillales bacterium 39-66-50]HQS15407.1 ABC transporter ATP-binding protein [Reyranella sp.]HQT11933.1 ABC transporter ATP-binding protein [Reyranella sp.]